MRLPAALLAGLLFSGCQSLPHPPIAQVEKVDLERFMGDWYVIASIPTFIETDAYNAVESYRLAADGTVETTFTFREGGFDGPLKRYTPRGYVLDRTSNAVWGMQFIWPIKADFRIAYLAPDYSHTVIARVKRDYVWIMARSPQIPEADYRRLEQFVAAQGYDVTRIRKVPQRWHADAPAAHWTRAPPKHPRHRCTRGAWTGCA
jgi:apolipoprotein D and lipocalin family protein